MFQRLKLPPVLDILQSRTLALAVAVLAVVVGGPAWARPAPVHLLYHTDPEIPDCPALAELKRSVEARLGAAPWDLHAERRLQVRVARSPEGRIASIEIRSREGALLGRRVLRSRQADCRELAEALALAIAIAIDPLHTPQPAAELPPASRPADREPPPSAGGSMKLLLGAGGAVAIGTAPRPAGSAAVTVGLRRRLFSLWASLRIDAPTFQAVPGGRISTWLGGGSLRACGHHGWLMGCGVVTLAALTAEGHELLEARSATRLYAGAGVRGALSLPLWRRLSATIHAEILFPFAAIRVVDSRTGAPFWSTPSASGTFGIDLNARFL